MYNQKKYDNFREEFVEIVGFEPELQFGGKPDMYYNEDSIEFSFENCDLLLSSTIRNMSKLPNYQMYISIYRRKVVFH